jgi:hypothetical protein
MAFSILNLSSSNEQSFICIPKPNPFKNPKLGTFMNVAATHKENQSMHHFSRLPCFLLFASHFILAYGWNRGPELNLEPYPSSHQSHWSYFGRHHHQQIGDSL